MSNSTAIAILALSVSVFTVVRSVWVESSRLKLLHDYDSEDNQIVLSVANLGRYPVTIVQVGQVDCDGDLLTLAMESKAHRAERLPARVEPFGYYQFRLSRFESSSNPFQYGGYVKTSNGRLHFDEMGWRNGKRLGRYGYLGRRIRVFMNWILRRSG